MNFKKKKWPVWLIVLIIIASEESMLWIVWDIDVALACLVFSVGILLLLLFASVINRLKNIKFKINH